MVLGATVALSFKGIAAKFAYDAGAGVGLVLLLRFALSVPLFWAGERLVNHGKPQGALGKREVLACAGTGILFLIATISDFMALSYSDAGMLRVILFTYPAFILLIRAIELRRWPARGRLIAFAVTYTGLLILVVPTLSSGGRGLVWQGVALALTSAISYALFLTRTQTLTNRLGSARFTALSNTAVLLFALPVLPWLSAGGGWNLSLAGLGWGAFIATVCTVLPFFLLFEGIRRWGAERAGLLSLTGPMMTLLMGWLLLGETLTPLQGVGVGVVMVGMMVLQLGERKAAPAPASSPASASAKSEA
ncbi:hypothetical protein ROR02_26690 [Pararhodospirillum oryzae]|uniref:EamA domain-containing protein n=2 Tax=Pararhodospirillum oryzae TaxID=478448 RepID=A0A512HAT1_9PROT|nr:hypothetical protein ROR02_26690 [Pararhodospirillum oryzae]